MKCRDKAWSCLGDVDPETKITLVIKKQPPRIANPCKVCGRLYWEEGQCHAVRDGNNVVHYVDGKVISRPTAKHPRLAKKEIPILAIVKM